MANKFFGEASAKVDGKDWTLRCDFNAMAEFEEATGKDAMEAFEKAEAGEVSIADLRRIVRAFLACHHPDATLRDAGDVLSHDVEVVQRVITAAMPTEEEAAALGNGKKVGATAA